MKKLFFYFILFNLLISLNSFSQSVNVKGDFDFYVIVLDQSKKPLANLEVKIKNEDEELMDKKNTSADGSIEFRGLFKNKSYHVEFYNYDERIKDSDKIYLKDQFKTEEITKAETGFDYFIFVGDNLSFSELGTKDAREDTPEEIAAKQNASQVASTQKEEKQETTKAEVVTSSNNENTNTQSEVKNEAVVTNTSSTIDNKESNKVEDVKKEPSITTESEEAKSSTAKTNNAVEENVSNNKEKNEIASNTENSTENKPKEDPSKTEVKQDIAVVENIKEEKKEEPILANNSTNKTSEHAKQEASATEKNNVVSNIDFTAFKEKDFNSPETHLLLIKEEEKINTKKIKYKVQVGAYTHQEVAEHVKIYGFGNIEKQNYPDGFTRLTVGNCKSLKEAEELRKKIIAKGITGAWIVGFHEGKRYTMKELVVNNFFQ